MCAAKFKVPSGRTVARDSSSELRPHYSEGGRYEEARIMLKCKCLGRMRRKISRKIA